MTNKECNDFINTLDTLARTLYAPRPATDDEVAHYELIEEIIGDDDDLYDKFVDTVSLWYTLCDNPDYKSNRDRVRRLAKKYHVTVDILLDWYGVEED